MVRTLRAVGVVLFLTACGGGGGGGDRNLSSPTAPTNPQNTNLGGSWVGTMTRPAGLGSIAVRWVATQDNNANASTDGNLNGPLTMTYDGVSVQAPVRGVFAGGSNFPGGIIFQIQLNAGGSSAFPTCSVLGTANFMGIPVGATSLTSAPFDVIYNQCRGFIDPTPPTNQTRESVVLSMTKQ